MDKEVKFDKGILGFLAPFLMRFLKMDRSHTHDSQAHPLLGLPYIDNILVQLRIKFEVAPPPGSSRIFRRMALLSPLPIILLEV